MDILKASLCLQLLLQFLVRFSAFDGCERVQPDTNVQVKKYILRTFVTNLSFTSVKRRKSHWKIPAKIASVNGPDHQNCTSPNDDAIWGLWQPHEFHPYLCPRSGSQWDFLVLQYNWQTSIVTQAFCPHVSLSTSFENVLLPILRIH